VIADLVSIVEDASKHGNVRRYHDREDDLVECCHTGDYLERTSMAKVIMPTPNRAVKPKTRKATMMRRDSMWCFMCCIVLVVGDCVKPSVRRVRA